MVHANPKRLQSIAVERAITKVYGRGRTQIPSILRRWLNVRDGDILVWEVANGELRVFKGRIERATTTNS